MKGYKFTIADTDGSSYQVYAKLGSRSGLEGKYPDQLRIVPGPIGKWNLPPEYTLARLEDTGNEYVFYNESGVRLIFDYGEMFYLRTLLEAQDRLRSEEPELEWTCEKIKVEK